ncbi:MAG: hypothetical protein GVX78_04245 [Bacteroidetes bacterium]|nr:hypothetical protein [Bacteroidota bacterium]
MINCKQATQRIEKEAEGKLSFMSRLELHLHLLMCKPCVRFKKQWQSIAKLINAETADLKLSKNDKEQMIRHIDEEILNS